MIIAFFEYILIKRLNCMNDNLDQAPNIQYLPNCTYTHCCDILLKCLCVRACLRAYVRLYFIIWSRFCRKICSCDLHIYLSNNSFRWLWLVLIDLSILKSDHFCPLNAHSLLRHRASSLYLDDMLNMLNICMVRICFFFSFVSSFSFLWFEQRK